MQHARFIVFLLALICGSCKEQSLRPGAKTITDASTRTSATATPIDPAQMFGDWRIVFINGRAALNADDKAKLDDTNKRVPHLRFRSTNFSGITGCNYFGGMSVLRGNRYYTYMGPMTLVACQSLMEQEDAITDVMRFAPLVSFKPDGTMMLSANGASIVLVKDALSPAKTAQAVASPAILAGTTWDIVTLDGALVYKRDMPKPRTITLEADKWTVQLACGTLSGDWKQQGNIIAANGDLANAKAACTPKDTAFDGVVTQVMKANPSFVRDIDSAIFAAGDHWILARDKSVMANEASVLTGHWRIATIDGKPPQVLSPESSPASLSFDGTAYRGSTGCNSVNGYFLAHHRRLFTLATPTTEIGCGSLIAQEQRIYALLGASPRIAQLASGGIALIDQGGKLELVRDPTKVSVLVPSQVTTLTSRSRKVELQSMDGESVRAHYSQPERFLSVSDQKWTTNLGCAGLAGDWKVEAPGFQFYTSPLPFEGQACPPQRQVWNDRLTNVLNGPSRVLIGINGEFLLAARDHWIIGRSVRN
jgi:heat shock protein HslJ